MGLIGTSGGKNMFDALREFRETKPTWGTCAGMILLAEKCIGASAVIENGQSLIGGLDLLVCRNYFGSQISSFEMPTPAPPGDDSSVFPGVFIRAPAILSVGDNVEILGKVTATPCRQAAVVLEELEARIAKGENVVMMGVVDALKREEQGGISYKEVKKSTTTSDGDVKDRIELPGAADGSNAREVICAVRKGHILCTAFHPELTQDYRWHAYFVEMVRNSMEK
mmetsp:Transcript_28692/g.66661  ORF Transcript_28692/g.66661 Transcript_28692/m.66661 type:complete len:225 (+) Transcript_28692:257-931(+)